MPFSLLLLHEELHHEDLLLVDLEADVFRNVWDQPVHKVTHEHHHILYRAEWTEGMMSLDSGTNGAPDKVTMKHVY